MSDRKMTIEDVVLPIARSRTSKAETAPPQQEPSAGYEQEQLGDTKALADKISADEAAVSLQTRTTPSRAKVAGTGIRALRLHKKATTGSQLNVKLDEPLKARLAKASYEHDVHQTVIVRAAIDEFLKKEGY
ncbi:hypothetical protein [Agrobacterium cavarae]|uniref:hypothetical protein n=1 Tax=Agrobacterium cavarae TaxID=2528239 RepID=UPI003EE4AE86